MAPDRVLPDTCAWIDFFKGSRTPLAETLVQSLAQREVVTCGIVLCELLQGVKKPGEELLVQNALQALPYLEMTRELWFSAGRLSATLRNSGHTLPMSDIIIATVAMNHDCAVLTVDRHFKLIHNLRIVNGL